MHKAGLLFVVIFFGHTLWAQPILDSLFFEYEDQVGSQKIETTINISSYYDNDNLFKSLEYANEALAFALDFGTKSDILTAYNRIGIVYYKLGDLSKSNEFFLLAIETSNDLKDVDLTNESRLMNNIANNYGELKQVELAIKYYKKSLALKKTLNDSLRFSITLNNMALTYSEMHYYDSAHMALKEAIKIDKSLHDSLSLAYSIGSIGEVFLDEGKADSATYYLNRSLKYFEGVHGSDYVLGYYHQQLGDASLLLEKYQIAYDHFYTALELTIDVGAVPIQRDCYKGLQKVSEKMGDYKKALEYGRFYNALQDSLFKTESSQKLSAIETSYQIKNKEQEISILNAKAEVDKFRLYGALAIAFLIFILLGFMYYRYLFKAKANTLLQQKNDTIQKQNKEIMDGVEYAKGIQEAILPEFSTIDTLFNSSFLYYKPTQVVSGDFYWVDKIDGNIILVLADGTGHGVPGAFLSVMGTSLLRQIITENRNCKPDDILSELNRRVIEGLGQSKLNSTLKDGMDVAVCTYDVNRGRLAFAGAKRPIILKTDNGVELIKGSRYSVGGKQKSITTYDLHYFDVKKGDSIVMFTDGVIDQFGGEENKKFLTTRLLDLVKRGNGIDGIQNNFENEMKSWRNGCEQTDDMLLLGVEI
jgi:serine phosphatase RsbU (regulator of sigma subunit)/Tfp pilus assembly protein PilF